MGRDKQTALLIVDVQNDFLPPNGKLAVDNGRSILSPICELLDPTQDWPWARVVASQDYHPEGHVSFVTSHPGCEDKAFKAITVKTSTGGEVEQILWPEHCIQGTSGCEIESSIQAGLKVWQSKGLYHLVQKGTDKQMDAYSAFASPSTPSVRQAIEKGTSPITATQDSPLASYLHLNGVKQIVIVGIATDVCVKATAEDALACGFEIVLIEEAMKGVDEEAAEKMIKGFGQVNAAQVIESVKEVHSLLL